MERFPAPLEVWDLSNVAFIGQDPQLNEVRGCSMKKPLDEETSSESSQGSSNGGLFDAIVGQSVDGIHSS